MRSNIEYAQGLTSMGFNYHNLFRMYRDTGNNKIYPKQLDWFMNNLIKRVDIEYAWACIEPDIDKMTKAIDPKSNHVHFAWLNNKNKELNRSQLANSMRINRQRLLLTKPIETQLKAMDYFTKHIGKSLSYHNIYY